jgi:hypothetical protein
VCREKITKKFEVCYNWAIPGNWFKKNMFDEFVEFIE